MKTITYIYKGLIPYTKYYLHVPISLYTKQTNIWYCLRQRRGHLCFLHCDAFKCRRLVVAVVRFESERPWTRAPDMHNGTGHGHVTPWHRHLRANQTNTSASLGLSTLHPSKRPSVSTVENKCVLEVKVERQGVFMCVSMQGAQLGKTHSYRG